MIGFSKIAYASSIYYNFGINFSLNNSILNLHKKKEVKTVKEEVYEKIKDELPEKLRKDIEKYSLENFDFEILDTASTEEELSRKQRKYIRKYNSLEPNGYNLPEE